MMRHSLRVCCLIWRLLADGAPAEDVAADAPAVDAAPSDEAVAEAPAAADAEAEKE